jgi:hypothetical protein
LLWFLPLLLETKTLIPSLPCLLSLPQTEEKKREIMTSVANPPRKFGTDLSNILRASPKGKKSVASGDALVVRPSSSSVSIAPVELSVPEVPQETKQDSSIVSPVLVYDREFLLSFQKVHHLSSTKSLKECNLLARNT